ncbi:MAG TPA: hypothetical protein VFW33_03645, partial [Gemmataceae bacterium]|nr:hypothetical protein [Gemmataceae bacterium]
MTTAPSWRADCLAGGAATLLGLLLSALPHLVAWQRTGRPEWFADHDDFAVYMLLGSRAYHDHPTYLTDPVCRGERESAYSSLQSAPGVCLARLLGLGPLTVNLTWRALSGIGAGLLWYALLRVYVARPVAAAALAALLLSDAGVVEGCLLYSHTKTAVALLTHPGETLPTQVHLMPQWRILNPGLSLPWLLLYLGCVARAVGAPAWWRTALAGVAFGLLFHVYFYLWTAAGLGLLLTTALDRPRWKTYCAIGGIGLGLGAPALWQTFAMRRACGTEWLLRQDKFLPVGHFAELLWPRLPLALLAACLVWVWWRRHDLAYLAGLAAGGFVLLNQQLFTGLQIENYHWKFAYGPALALLTLLACVGAGVPASRGGRAARTAAWFVVPIVVVSGLGFRVLEATRGGEAARITGAVGAYREQRPAGCVPPLRPNTAVAGDPDFVVTASILEDTRPLDGYAVLVSPTVGDAEWDTRAALDGVLRGLSRDEFRREQLGRLKGIPWGPWGRGRSAAAREERLRKRLEA